METGTTAISLEPSAHDRAQASGATHVGAIAIGLLERQEYDEALATLDAELEENPSSTLHALRGTALFLLERYAESQKAFEHAAANNGTHSEVAELLALAGANVASAAERSEPTSAPFEREQLLAPPPADLGLPALPGQPAEPARHPFRRALEQAAGRVLRGLSKASEPLVRAVGVSDEVWTNWYRRPTFLALVALNYTREQLHLNNRKDTYPAGELSAFQARGLQAPVEAKMFRTADGSWNNLNNPKEGAAGIRFPRNVRRTTTWPRRDLLDPNPAEISHVLFTRPEAGIKEVPFLNLLAASWIQFMVHDWVSHRIMPVGLGAHEIPLPVDHPARERFHQTKLFVGRTAEDPTRMAYENDSPPTYINEVTSWWDGSQIYGSSLARANALRSFRSGKLRLDGEYLPIGDNGIELTGFDHNWWLGLAMLHTLFVREHNAICDMLQAKYPSWNDARLYGTARLINAAVIAKIHTVEWTPAILPNRVLNYAMNANWSGLLDTFLHRRSERRIFRGFKVASHAIGGIVGNYLENHGIPYGLSDEFTEVYRLHDLLPDELRIMRIAPSNGERPATQKLSLAATRSANVRAITTQVGLTDLFYSFGNQHPGQLVLNNYPKTMQTLSIPGNPVYDMAAVDILRARERGVPRYNEFRRQIGLNPIRSFEDLTSDPTQLSALKCIYRNDLEAIDLLVGTRAESQRPTGYGFGETMFQIFILNASLRLQADRFFTESYNAETYTQEGIDWIDRADFRAVLLRHFTQLNQTGLNQVDNAFEPWDTGALSLDRHPLRAFM